MLRPSCTMLSPGREGRDLQQNFLDVTVPPSFSSFSYLIKQNVILGLKKKKKAQRVDSVNSAPSGRPRGCLHFARTRICFPGGVPSLPVPWSRVPSQAAKHGEALGTPVWKRYLEG